MAGSAHRRRDRRLARLSTIWSSWSASNWERAGGVATTLLGYLSRSGFAVLALVANIVLMPVLTFFFLRDWDLLVERVAALVPRDHLATVSRLARESSDVLGAFLRGQFMVMLILGVMYGLGLWARRPRPGHPDRHHRRPADLRAVPRPDQRHHPGRASPRWCSTATGSTSPACWRVFGVGQVIESYWLTPKLVGDRIGLHPVAVIFAVLAGGQLFGFLGMLLALPVAAVANVLLRYAQERYTRSRLYAGEQPSIAGDRHLAQRGDVARRRRSAGRQ